MVLGVAVMVVVGGAVAVAVAGEVVVVGWVVVVAGAVVGAAVVVAGVVTAGVVTGLTGSLEESKIPVSHRRLAIITTTTTPATACQIGCWEINLEIQL